MPSDPRQLLRLFSGTSVQMLRRASWLSAEDDVSISGRRYRPQLPGVEDETPELTMAASTEAPEHAIRLKEKSFSLSLVMS